MWIKTDYDELINTDRLSMIRYDKIERTTFGWSGKTKLIISNFDSVQTIMNGILRGSNLVEVKK